MNIFEAVKQSVTTRQAAEYYGLSVNRSGKVSCPFHNDRTPSMKVDNRFHCFGCGADGDVIDFAARFHGLGAKEAAEKLAEDFQISYSRNTKKSKVRLPVKRKSQEQMYLEMEKRYYRVLSDYFCLLRQWERIYAPKPEDENWHPLFAEAMKNKAHIEYLLDVLLYEPIEERALLVRDYGKKVIKLEQRLSEFGTGAEGSLTDDGRVPALPNGGRSQRTSGVDR